ncbi:MAG: type II secretion system F family protein [Acidobacteriia bacterium]|nr:type II secretion system F family protein [Terriglobia bacterium]
MPVYTYRARTRTGTTISGERTADNQQVLAAILRREQVSPLAIKEKRKGFAGPSFGGKVKAKELAIFTRQFSVMIDAGLPLVQALESLGSQMENKVFKKVVTAVRSDVEGGSTLANAMRNQPKVFDDLYTNMIAAGEAGGILDTILQRLSTYIEKSVKLKRAVRSALIYPCSIMTIAMGVVALILVYVVPTFITLFAGLGVPLPIPTQIVIALSRFMTRYGLFILFGLGIFAVAFRSYYSTQAGRYNVDALLLKLPVFGMLLRKIAVARFSRTLSTLITSGVPLLEALDVTAKTAGNAVIEKAIQDTRKAVEQGRTIVDPLKQSNIFPPMVTQMISVGEQTGAMDAMLTKIAEFYEEEVDAGVKDLLTAMEPMLIVFLGVVVGGIVISMYLPLFTLIDKLSG